MFTRRFTGACLTALLITSIIPSAHGQSSAGPQSATDANPWPPSGVHLFNEPGLTRPALLHEVKPIYTETAMRARVQGSVTLTAVIEADGSVGPVRVAHSLDQELDAKAIEAAKQWLFSPATLNGTAVPVLITIDLSFRLSDTPASEFVFSWPDAFPAAPVTVPNEDSWTVDVEHADNLEVRVARPSDWIAFPQADHVDRISANHRILLSVGKPRAFPRSIDRPMERAQLLALGQMIAQQTRTGATSLAAAGQVQTPSGLWVWFELPTTIEDSELRRALGGVPQVYDGMTQWAFAGTLGGHLVQVGCGVMREHGRTDGQFMQDKRDAGLLCERIMQRMTITTK